MVCALISIWKKLLIFSIWKSKTSLKFKLYYFYNNINHSIAESFSYKIDKDVSGYLIHLHSFSKTLKKLQPWKSTSKNEVLEYISRDIRPNENYIKNGQHILIHGTDEFPLDNHLDFYATLKKKTTFEFIPQQTTLDNNLETTSVAM